MIAYPVKINKNDTKEYFLIDFIDFNMCTSWGKTFEEAKEKATDILTQMLEQPNSETFPAPSVFDHPENDIHYIKPRNQVYFAKWLKRQRVMIELPESELASCLGITVTEYENLENPDTSNPSDDVLNKLQNIFEADFLNF